MEQYTQEQVEQMIGEAKSKWEQEILQPLQAEVEELQKYKPKEETEAEKQIKQLKAELLQAKVVAALKDADLDDFVEILEVKDDNDLKEKLEKLTKIIENRKLKNSYQPHDHKNMDTYSKAEKNNDVAGMIHAKLSKLFN